MLFLFNALVIGAGVNQVSARFPVLQQTVVLFVLGMIFSICMEAFHLKEKTGVLGGSYEMWMTIDPHLLMVALLPALLAGDAMTIDTSVAKRVAYQCLYLAGPGVVISTFATAGFLRVYQNWDFLLCMVAGSILCATDPVAVVALLKELGASPVLTVQIQGESLLNDGTAIVLFLISYDMLSGTEHDTMSIAMFLVKKAMMAWALGLFIGYLFFSWIRAANNRLSHASSSIQIALTLCCAYWSFILVEVVLGLSGVLATVASSLVLAHHMWPHIVSPDSVHHVWHTVEALGNTIVFFLAGALTGEAVTHVEFMDCIDLVVLYIFLFLLRGALVFLSRPILTYLVEDKQKVTFADAAVMTWGGLRGAVGLALAIWVLNERAPARDKDGNLIPDGETMINEKDAQRLLFFVSGIAFLTTIINAVTAPALVQKLGITALPQARQQLLRMFHQQLVNWSEDSSHPKEVTESLRMMLEEAAHHIDSQQVSDKGPKCARTRTSSGSLSTRSNGTNGNARPTFSNKSVISLPSFSLSRSRDGIKGNVSNLALQYQLNSDVVEEFNMEKAKYAQIKPEDLKFVAIHLPEDSFLGHESLQEMIDLCRDVWVDEGMAKVVNSCFLNLVYANYWKLIENGNLRPGSAESETLLTSVRVSLSPYRVDLMDFNVLQDHFQFHHGDDGDNGIFTSTMAVTDGGFLKGDAEFSVAGSRNSPNSSPSRSSVRASAQYNAAALAHSVSSLSQMTAAERAGASKSSGFLNKVVSSIQFNIGVAIAIFLNSIQVAVEEGFRTDENSNHPVWLILDTIFTLIFNIEFLLKFALLRFGYFKDAWNRFDFFLVVLGNFGLVMSFITFGEDNQESTTSQSEASDKARVIRVARVLRTLRFLRVFRLFHAKLSADRYVSVELANHLQKIQTLVCFAQSHLQAEKDLVKYFGCNGKIDDLNEVEIARCILQSQVGVYRALRQAVHCQQELDKELLTELHHTTERKHITETLEKFVISAHTDGAINARETHAILHPLHHQIASCLTVMHERAEGLVTKETKGHVVRKTTTFHETLTEVHLGDRLTNGDGSNSLINGERSKGVINGEGALGGREEAWTRQKKPDSPDDKSHSNGTVSRVTTVKSSDVLCDDIDDVEEFRSREGNGEDRSKHAKKHTTVHFSSEEDDGAVAVHIDKHPFDTYSLGVNSAATAKSFSGSGSVESRTVVSGPSLELPGQAAPLT
jgi:sodium/hydrogen exchanger 10/11